MTLSELVAYRNQLNSFSLAEAMSKTDLDIGHIKHLINNVDFDPDNFKDRVTASHENLHRAFDEFQSLITTIKQRIDEEIAVKEEYWMNETWTLYQEAMINDSDEHILNRRPMLSEEHDNIIRNRIVGVSNSRHPGMIIRPGLETFVQNMVSFDPLYLVDKSEDMLFPCVLEFPELYQRRLRRYIVDEYDSTPILERLPDNQFAVCLAYNFFNFKPIPVIDRYLTEIFAKLKPGGRLMMTFNDCDNEMAVRLAERYYACYTPGRMVKSIAERIGYEIYFIWNDQSPTTWIELQKPGTLTGIRGGQALAKIVHKT
jgi:hypothetical protein